MLLKTSTGFSWRHLAGQYTPEMGVVGAALVATCLCVATDPMRAQTVDQKAVSVIEWSKDRKLTRADFQATFAVTGDFAALSAVGIEAAWTCDGDRLDARIRAVFDRSQSWWRGSTRRGSDAQVLQHEQTHFDIAEVIARKIRSRLAELADACARDVGTIPLEPIISNYQLELDDEQARYDHETAFGRDAGMQLRWTSQILRTLDAR